MLISVTRRTTRMIASIGMALLAAGCFGGDDAPPLYGIAGQGAPAASKTATAETVTRSMAGTRTAAEAALIGIMRTDATDPFAIALDALPPDLVALLDEMGVDLRLGAALSVQGGVLTILFVFPGSPAERAGLITDDAVLRMGSAKSASGTTLGSAAELRAAVQSVAPGFHYALDIRRTDRLIAVSIERESDGAIAWRSAALTILALELLVGDAARK